MTSAADFLPDRLNLTSLRRAAEECRGCHLHENATQTVFGEGLKRSRLMLVGEMPGDKEDEAGKPFVGPSGRLLDESLVDAGIDRDEAYVTNVVKHFKWEAKGWRRKHSTPGRTEIRACMPWFEAEVEVVMPEVVVALGATAAKALLGPGFRVTRQRGEFLEARWAPFVTATVHPSSILRAPDSNTRRLARGAFIEDLRKIAAVLNGG